MRKILFATVAALSLGACSTVEDMVGGNDDARPVATSETRTLDGVAASELMDMDVIGRDGESLGDVKDVLVDSRGRPQQVVLSRGGVMGLGAKDVAIDVDDLRRAPSRNALVATDVTRETADSLPEARMDGSLVSLSKGGRS